jgi:hypothetical protein
MNDIKSLLIATTVLAIGGLGLYMYKTEENELDYEDDYTESGSELESELDLDNLEEEELEDLDNYSPKKTKKDGTKRNTKKKSGTRKKY